MSKNRKKRTLIKAINTQNPKKKRLRGGKGTIGHFKGGKRGEPAKRRRKILSQTRLIECFPHVGNRIKKKKERKCDEAKSETKKDFPESTRGKERRGKGQLNSRLLKVVRQTLGQ